MEEQIKDLKDQDSVHTSENQHMTSTNLWNWKTTCESIWCKHEAGDTDLFISLANKGTTWPFTTMPIIAHVFYYYNSPYFF